jgi:YVTN family beta-propeller protein
VHSHDLSVIDAESLTVLATLVVGSMPYGVAASPDGTLILVSDQAAGVLSMIDAKTLEITARVKVGQYPEGIAFGLICRQLVFRYGFCARPGA